MCGIVGIVSLDSHLIPFEKVQSLASLSISRGKDSSGFLYLSDNDLKVVHSNDRLSRSIQTYKSTNPSLFIGHARLTTNSSEDRQPVTLDQYSVCHNGIVVNHEQIKDELNIANPIEIDSSVFNYLAREHKLSPFNVGKFSHILNTTIEGAYSISVVDNRTSTLYLFSNHQNLYYGYIDQFFCFASEAFILSSIGCKNQILVPREGIAVSIPVALPQTYSFYKCPTKAPLLLAQVSDPRHDVSHVADTSQYLRRCTRCILPHTMPFISFNSDGVCNYCLNYSPPTNRRTLSDLTEKVAPYRRHNQFDCIVPFSGGRDSTYALYVIKEKLKLNPITYTYDWGMLTDLGRRNISRVCAQLDVPNIIYAADISFKRSNIRKNLTAWLRKPHLGMLALLTSGDKFFFKHLFTTQRSTGINLNIWGINPLETTHFKAGFLGIPPSFSQTSVYTKGKYKQLIYQYKRLEQFAVNPAYLNSSLFDTYAGEYYRTYTRKKDYFHLFDFMPWSESECDRVLRHCDWEFATDTTSSWRIGDATAAFYNYIYYTVAGFTEHDTFRSNQIREGMISRDEALSLVKHENLPRFPNIKWYLDILGLPFQETLETISRIPRLYCID